MKSITENFVFSVVNKALAKIDVDYKELIWRDTEEKIHELETSKASSLAGYDENANFEKELLPLKNNFNEILDKEMNLVTHFTKIHTIKNKLDLLKENQKELQKQIKVKFLGSTTELSTLISNCDECLR